MEHALRGIECDRVPVLPKIWVDFSAKYLGIDIENVLENPYMAMEVIRRAALMLSLDGFRTFFFPARNIKSISAILHETDDSGKVLGEIDTDGGLATILNDVSQDIVDISNPYYIAFCQFYKRKNPWVENVEDANRIAVPDGGFYRSLGFDKMLKRMQENAHGMAVIGDCGTGSLSHLVYMMGMERAMFAMVDNPKLAHMILEKGTQIAVEKGKVCIDSGLKILRLNDSVGNMSVVSPEMWKEFVLPVFREVCCELKSYCPDVLIYSHICGNVFPVAKELASSGIDCIGPMDPLGGYCPAEYRKSAGDNICLMGGVNTITLLNGSREDVAAECIGCIKQAGSKGGYVLGSGCAVPRDTPSENIKAMVEAAVKFGSNNQL